MSNKSNSLKTEHLILSTACLGMFLSTLDSGIMNVALPYLGQYFNVALTTISWTISFYFLILSSTIIIFGKLSDRLGRIKIFTVGLALFALGSMLCALSDSALSLIISRGIQGLGAAMLQATAAALITTLILPERSGLALGTLTLVMGIGPIAGPTVSGILLSTLNWRWLFWINIPLCLYGIWMCRNITDNLKKYSIPLNIFPNIMLSMIIFCVMLIMIIHEKIYQELLIAFTILISLVFIWHQNHTTNPVLNLRFLQNRVFRLSLFSTLVFGITTATVLIVPPLFLQQIFQFSPWQIGIISFCTPLGVVSTARLSGKYIKSVGAVKLMLAGFLLMALSLFGLSCIDSHWNPLLFIPLLLLYGVGGGLFQPANISAILSSASMEQQSTLSAVNRMIHNFGNALGVTIAAFFLTKAATIKATTFSGFFYCWNFAFSLIFIAVLWFFFLESKNKFSMFNKSYD